MTLLTEITTKCSAALRAGQNPDAIAAAVNAGRTRVQSRQGGIGLVLDTLGPIEGAAVLDTLNALKATNSAIKWAWVLIERGDLDFGAPATRAMIDQLAAGGAMTTAQAAALKGTAEVADPVTEHDVRRAIWSDAGEYLA